jgi:hypothetical protein
MQVAGTRRSSAHRDLASELSLRSSRERANLFMADMNPTQLTVAPYCITDGIEAIPITP